jgi:hypothetical protein
VRGKTSLWWKDLVGLGVVRGVTGDWLHDAFEKRLDNRRNIKFWLDTWCGSVSLVDAFSRLFRLSLQAEDMIYDMRVRTLEKWSWQLKWKSPFLGYSSLRVKVFFLSLSIEY